MTTVSNLRELGFKVEPATVGVDLTRVWHQEPFRYYSFRLLFLTGEEGAAAAQKAGPDASGSGYSFLITDVWKQQSQFPFAFIMEKDMVALDQMQLSVDNVKLAIESLQANLKALLTQQTALAIRVTIV